MATKLSFSNDAELQSHPYQTHVELLRLERDFRVKQILVLVEM